MDHQIVTINVEKKGKPHENFKKNHGGGNGIVYGCRRSCYGKQY